MPSTSGFTATRTQSMTNSDFEDIERGDIGLCSIQQPTEASAASEKITAINGPPSDVPRNGERSLQTYSRPRNPDNMPEQAERRLHNYAKHSKPNDGMKSFIANLQYMNNAIDTGSGSDPPASFIPGQCIFLCITHPRGSFAVPVGCNKPKTIAGKIEQLVLVDQESESVEENNTLLEIQRQTESYKSNEHSNEDHVSDCDSLIYRRLRSAAFSHHGWWKEWIPFYDIVDVEEVIFTCEGPLWPTGSLPVRVARLDVKHIAIEAKKTEEKEERISNRGCKYLWFYVGEEYCDGDGFMHSDDCFKLMRDLDRKCAGALHKEAQKLLSRIDRLGDLKKCFLDPSVSDGRETLKGMVQDTCVYAIGNSVSGNGLIVRENDRLHQVIEILPDRVRWEHVDNEVRGIHVKFGWRWSEIERSLPMCIASATVILSIVWVSVLVWGGRTGDWQSAFGFGSLALGSVAFLGSKLYYDDSAVERASTHKSDYTP